jgi:hypothetical protein
MSRNCKVVLTPTGALISWLYCEINFAPVINAPGATLNWQGPIPDAPSKVTDPLCEFKVIAVGVTGATYTVDITIDDTPSPKSQLRTLVGGGSDVYQTTI